MPWVCAHGFALFLSRKLGNGGEPSCFQPPKRCLLSAYPQTWTCLLGCKSASLDTSVKHNQHIHGTKHSVNVNQQFIILKYQCLSKTCSFSHTGRAPPYLYIYFWARLLQRPRALPKMTRANKEAVATRQLSLMLINNVINVLQSLPEHFFCFWEERLSFRSN